METLEAALPVVGSALPLVGGVALVENFHEETAHVEAIPAGSFTDREPALLEQAYDEMATLPVDDIDLLVVDELGKDVSGAGMDTNVIGRYRVLNAPDPDEPSIKLLYARGLTEATKGNGNGIGLADITRQAALDQLDLQKTYANAPPAGRRRRRAPPRCAGRRVCYPDGASALGGYDQTRPHRLDRPHGTSRRSTSPSRLSMSASRRRSHRSRVASASDGKRRFPGVTHRYRRPRHAASTF